jgi:adenylosuccinate synthase
MHAQAIIGAGFGDEGKGYWTDVRAAQAVARGLDPWVVRFNSGAQAGHTVETPDGRRHVFHHVGSGSFMGAGTFLGPEVALHPMLFFEEMEQLEDLGVPTIRIAVDPRSPVTTPYDIMINQAAEAARGAGRHGSCGVGFGETVERNLNPEFALRASDLRDEHHLRTVLRRIQTRYIPERLNRLGFAEDAVDPWRWNDGIVERFLHDAGVMGRRVDLKSPAFLRSCKAVVFEGAQGLRLDQDLGAFPFVTRSYTGLPNLLALAEEAGIETVHVTYGTRAYLTRHGAGPLDDELEQCPAPLFSDPTNRPNAHQGALRFAHLDPEALKAFVARDLARARGTAVRVTHDLSVNCLDQMGPTTRLRSGEIVPTQNLPGYLASVLEIDTVHQSWGPTRATATTPIRIG